MSFDVKKELRSLYAPKADGFSVVDVPTLSFLMIDGHGDPNTAAAYRDAVQTLYPLSYAVRAEARRQLEKVHTVAPLEALWSAEDLTAFTRRDKDAWDWTVMIAQPEWITADLVAEATRAAAEKDLPALELARFEPYPEGRSAQILHVGSYDSEGPTLQRLHQEFLPAQGLRPSGRHHEIYLSDPRKTEPARLRTILRQPVVAAG
ncbi:GyrI-like domain-containing protein [Rhodococcus sp. X156]|uniref:GyrI-like domain-containing protein n=1 Tax=Rhodococcus sp. X156 TaxID=2499145 RepID=UPI0032169090